MSNRKQPIRVLKSPLSNRYYAVTRYTEGESGFIHAHSGAKQDVTEDVEDLIKERVEPESRRANQLGAELSRLRAKRDILASLCEEVFDWALTYVEDVRPGGDRKMKEIATRYHRAAERAEEEDDG